MSKNKKQQLNITCGSDVVLHDRLIFDGETFDPNLSVGIAANLVNSIGKRTALDVEVENDHLVIDIPWVSGRLPGCYGLEVTGSCNSKRWSTYADSLIKYTKVTRPGVGDVTVESDYYDITQEVGYRFAEGGNVDDVLVNGTSVVQAGKARITMPTKVSELENDSDFATQDDVEESRISEVEATIDDNVGTPEVEATLDGHKLTLAFQNLLGDGILSIEQTTTSEESGGVNIVTVTTVGGKVVTFQVKNGEKGDTVILGDGVEYTLYNGTGSKTDGAMTQKATTNAIMALKEEERGFALNNSFTGKDNEYVEQKIYGLLPDTWYSLHIPDPTWDMTGVTSTGVKRFSLDYVANGYSTNIANVLVGHDVSDRYDFKTPSDFEYIIVAGRATEGVEVAFSIEMYNIFAYANNIYVLNNLGSDFEIEESAINNGSIYIKDTVWLVRGSAILDYVNNSSLATAIGVSLVTSPSGVANCIEIPNNNSLVFDASERKISIKGIASISEYDLVLLYCNNGRIRKLGYGLESGYILPRIKKIESRLPEIDFLNVDKQYRLNDRFVGKGNDTVERNYYNFLPNRHYRVLFPDPEWDMTGVTSTGVNRLWIQAKNGSTITNLITRPKVTESVNRFYDIVTPAAFDYIIIGGRAGNDVSVGFVVEDVEKEHIKSGAQFYATNKGDLVIRSVGSDLFFKTSSNYKNQGTAFAGRGSVNMQYSMDALAEALGVSLVNISSIETGYIKLEDEKCFVIDCETKLPAIKNRTAVTSSDVVLLANNGGVLVCFNDNVLGDAFFNERISRDNALPSLEPINNDYIGLMQSAEGEVETFMFFTDPHWFSSYNEFAMSDKGQTYFKRMKQVFDSNPIDFVLCGGDWLTDHKQSSAVKNLSYIDAMMRKAFGEHYYMMFGNHDDNYQGELDDTSDTSANDGILNNQQMINFLFRRWKKMYYTFVGSSSRFYIFDTGIDWAHDMTGQYVEGDYRWEQIDWFAKQLLANNDKHIILGLHITKNTTESSSYETFATNIAKIASAFNNRTSITINSITYDFSGIIDGTVHCIICGHTHSDWEGIIEGIPVIATVNCTNSLAFDMVVIDYEASQLKTIRVGTGSNREIDLV